MAAESQIHNNLVAMTKNMAGGVPKGRIKDDLTGIRELAGNEAEAEIADVIQTMSFTTWIQDICDGIKQERELDKGTAEYNANAESIRENIQNINTLGKQMGMEGDIIEMPKRGEETMAAANAVYKDFALPYEAGADVDYAKYMQMQEGRSGIAQAMKKLSAAVAKSPQYGREAKAYWNAQTEAANHHNALTGEFLDGLESLDKYQDEITKMEAFLSDSAAKGDKIDFEGDDEALSGALQSSIANAKKMIKTERAMLKAGHIDTDRRNLFETNLRNIMTTMKAQKARMAGDDMSDMIETVRESGVPEPTSEENVLMAQMNRDEEAITTTPQKELNKSIDKYMDMVKTQKSEKPNLTMKEFGKQAKETMRYIGLMNTALRLAGVTPITTTNSSMQMVMLGHMVHGMVEGMKKQNAGVQGTGPKLKGPGKKMPDIKEVKTETSDMNVSQAFAKDVKNQSEVFADKFRRIMREEMSEEEPDEKFIETIEHVVGDVVDANGNVIMEAGEISGDSLERFSNTIVTGTGEPIFDKHPSEMDEREKKIASSAVTAVMAPMKGTDGKYLENFSNCYAVGIEELPEAQGEYTDAMTSLMIVGQPEAALAIRNNQTELMDLSREYTELGNSKDLSHVEDDTDKYKEINEKAVKADDSMRKTMDVYKPLIMKAGLAAGTAAYQKRKFNEAWKDSIRERNLQGMCQGTLQAMEESRQENRQLDHERLYGPHGLLRG